MTIATINGKRGPTKKTSYPKSFFRNVKKNCWDKLEDAQLLRVLNDYDIEREGKIRWTSIASQMNNRNAKQVRERWLNHLRPDLIKGEWSHTEEIVLFELQGTLGNKWKAISQILQRSDNDVKNRWNSKGYAKYHKILSSGSLNTTTTLLKERAAKMTAAECSSQGASLRLIQGIPGEILAPFEILAESDCPSKKSGTPPESRADEDGVGCGLETISSTQEELQSKLKHDHSKIPWDDKAQTRAKDPINDVLNDDGDLDSVAALIALERANCLPLLTAVNSATWADGFRSLGRYDTTTTTHDVGLPCSVCQTPVQPAISGSYLPSRLERPVPQQRVVHLLDPNLQFHASPFIVDNSFEFFQSRTFLGRTFFSPSGGARRNHEESGMTSPFGATQFV